MWLPFSSGHYFYDGKFSLLVKIFSRCRFIQMMRGNSSSDLRWNNENKMIDGWTQRFHRSFAIEWNVKCWPLSFLLYTMNANYFKVVPLYYWIWIPFLKLVFDEECVIVFLRIRMAQTNTKKATYTQLEWIYFWGAESFAKQMKDNACICMRYI